MDVSIIIVNYNTLSLVKECIDSIFDKTSDIEYEVIVVDNASTDGSQIYFQEDNRVLYIYSEENLGFGRANNLGIEIAKGRNILFLNPDTLLINNAIKILSDYLDANDIVGACGGNLFDASMRPALSYKRILPSIVEEISSFLFHIPERVIWPRTWYFNKTNNIISVAYVSGADLMVKSSVLQEIGAFSKDFFMYYEETDLCARIHSAHFIIKSVPNAHIQHLEGKSIKESYSERRLILSNTGRHTYFKRNHSINHHRIANRILLFRLFVHKIFYSIIGNDSLKKSCEFEISVVKRQIVTLDK